MVGDPTSPGRYAWCTCTSYNVLSFSGYRRGSSTPIEDVKETLYRKFSGSEDIEHTVPSFTRVGKGGSVKALSQKFQQAAGWNITDRPIDRR